MESGDPDVISFSHRIRGYDPDEVDEYLAQVTQYLQQLEIRANSAERSLERQSVELAGTRQRLAVEGGAEVPARLSQILDLAHEEAQEIHERARAEARSSADLAARRAEELVDEAVKERGEIERHVERLAATRAGYLHDLRDLSAQIVAAAEHYELHLDDEASADDAATVYDAATDAPIVVEATVDSGAE